ncbi:DUF6053 domain-containing protein [Lysobacter enzymogenes]|uniref:DUF6053 domain-containing protein n=1 Tax=Lysobacter enzymogenes TaxID=69 RepID=UPI003D18B470
MAGGFVGGPSGPALFDQCAVLWNKSVGAEAPPPEALRRWREVLWECLSGPALFDQCAVLWNKSVGAETPPTEALRRQREILWEGLSGPTLCAQVAANRTGPDASRLRRCSRR